jgi:diaminohydroxyphosphoribosylaminopyrimidine deaminase / 5-amino-6-(5-phosphoribosylamino)uracil reductase
LKKCRGANYGWLSRNYLDQISKLKDLIALANERGFNQVLIESGPTFGTALLREDLIDEIVLFQAPTLFGSGKPAIGDLGITNISDD